MRARLIGCLLCWCERTAGRSAQVGVRKALAGSVTTATVSPACRRTPRYSRFLDQGRRDVDKRADIARTQILFRISRSNTTS